MDPLAEARFEKLLMDAVGEAKDLGYQPSEFIKMIRADGAFATVKRIVPKARPSDGFNKLTMLKRLDLTCEAMMLAPEWRPYFDEDILDIARRRLTEYGYRFPPEPSPEPTTLESPEAGAEPDEFVPPDDHRERALREVVARSRQHVFRSDLAAIYGWSCCVTGTSVPAALEAAHISAYRGEQSNHRQNGLLLRADLHTMFDKYLWSIDPSTLTVVLGETLAGTEHYRALEGRSLTFDGQARPSSLALSVHFRTFREAR